MSSTRHPDPGPAEATPAEAEAFHRVGLPETAVDRVTEWLIAGLTPDDVAPYCTRSDVPPGHYSYVPYLIRHALTAETVFAFHDAGVTDPVVMIELRHATPEVAASWLAPFRTPSERHYLAAVSRSFATAYDRATSRTQGNTALVNAFFEAVPADPDARFVATFVADAVDDWVDPATRELVIPVSPQRAVALFAAGYTPDEVRANPDLATADEETLALLIALRR